MINGAADRITAGAWTSGPRLRGFFLVFVADISELLRARWYQIYVGVFAVTMALFFGFGLTQSSLMGFTGLSRMLLTFIQINIIVLPVFILVTTARTFVGDRERGVWEYLLSWPLGLQEYFWGKALGRVTAIASPLVAGLLATAGIVTLRGGTAPWNEVAWICLFLLAMTVCFCGISVLISVLARTQEIALGAALVVWLACEAVIDALLLGVLVQQKLPAEAAITLALSNPLQLFRTASISVFDPEMSLLGPIAHTLLETPGPLGLRLLAVAWPIILGMVSAGIGSRVFAERDLIA